VVRYTEVWTAKVALIDWKDCSKILY